MYSAVAEISLAVIALCMLVRPILQRFATVEANHLDIITRFYESAPRLIGSEDLPPQLAQFLLTMSNDMNNPHIVRLALVNWLRGRFSQRPKSAHRERFFRSVEALPQHLRDEYCGTLATGLIAMTYCSPIFGSVLRHLLFMPVGMPQRSDDAPRFTFETVGAQCPA
jgi:hypothetical protein